VKQRKDHPTKPPGHQPDAPADRELAQLRRRAEEKLLGQQLAAYSSWPDEARRALEGLRTHQIELEMQNEELRSAREQLEASRARYFDLYELAPVGYITLSRAGLVLEANLTAATLLDVPRSELPGKQFASFIFRGDEEVFYYLMRDLEKGLRSQTCELRMSRNDGSIFWARLEAAVSLDEGGAPGWRIVISDVTERRRVEQDLKQSEERLRYAERLAHIGHWTWEIKKNSLSWSDEVFRIFGHSPDNPPTYDAFFRMIVPAHRERVRKAIRDCLSVKGGSSVEFEIARPDGEARTVTSTAEASLNEKGSPERVFGVLQDITDTRRTQEASFARQKLESVGTLASGIAHDFNNLLGGVMAQAELALEEYHAGASPEEELNRIRDGAIRGSEIVRQLMIYAGKESEAVGLVDISQVARGMIELLKVSVSKHAALVTDFGPGLPAVRGSAGQIQQIVMNLVTNAAEALDDKDGVIRVATRRVDIDGAEAALKGIAEGDYVELEVADTGRGMSAETQARIFDPFFTTKDQGHGLGLGVVRGIVRGLGGAIHLSSQLGKGTSFQIFLRSTGIMAGTSGPLPSAGDSGPPPSATILVVEDDDALRVALAQILRRRGFETLDAANGADAINLLRANSIKIDMMLLDMTIPGPSSHDVAAVAAETRPGLKLVLTSAYDEKLVRSTVGATQACSFVRKPFQIEELVQTLRQSLSARAAPG
jgi:two-component system cell cycle sensor histidine kinase/response regulator CckA